MKTVRVVSGDAFALDAVVSAFVGAGLEVLPSFSSGAELLESKLEETDAILLDMDLPLQESWELVEILGNLPLFKRPFIFALCHKLGEKSLQYVAPKVTYCFLRPVLAEHIAKTVISLLGAGKISPNYAAPYAFADALVTDSLISLGVPPHLQGFHFLREAIKLILLTQNSFRLSIMGDIYPAVAALGNCTVSRAEHAMRHAIDSAWMRAPLATLQSHFGYTTPAHRSTPSNSAFLHTLATQISHALPQFFTT